MQNTELIHSIVDQLKPFIEFNQFFKLNDGEKELGFFWHDQNGNSVDCNIYQPKYGGITRSIGGKFIFIEFAASSLENHTRYQSENKNILCKWYLECLCIDNGRFYSKDGIELIKVPFSTNQFKIAATNEDFEFIYERERKEANSEDTDAFRKWLIAKVLEMRAFEQSLPASERKRSLDIQALADKFLAWLEKKANAQSLVGNADKEVNDYDGSISYAVLSLIHLYPVLARDIGAKGISSMTVADKLCKEYRKPVRTAAKQLYEKYQHLQNSTHRLVARRKDLAEEFIKDLESAYSKINENEFPKGKALLLKELKDYKKKIAIDNL